MKSILMSIQPKWVAKIFNGKKLEIRKRFLLDYRGWVYIYCTKGKPNITDVRNKEGKPYTWVLGDEYNPNLNGKVVARFYCDNVEKTFYQKLQYEDDLERLCKGACLTEDELWEYAQNNMFYAIHISQLEIFDKPKELSEFYTKHYPQFVNMVKNKTHYELTPLTKAPQSWQFIEVK